mmetsp:Transcript_67060/g.143498  ORF Transcript_67060/g.143498 Transcript_67060/m.143498 type:complete len:277 (+) Transcript_67060:69-899(+)
MSQSGSTTKFSQDRDFGFVRHDDGEIDVNVYFLGGSSIKLKAKTSWTGAQLFQELQTSLPPEKALEALLHGHHRVSVSAPLNQQEGLIANPNLSAVLGIMDDDKDLWWNGHQPAVLRARGYTAERLHAAGYWAQELSKAGYEIHELREAGYADRHILMAGYEAHVLREAGYQARDLKSFGYSDEQILEAGYKAWHLCDARELRKGGHEAHELREIGFEFYELRKAGYKAHELRKANYPDELILTAGYQLHELVKAGYQMEELTLDAVRGTRWNMSS